jgi:leader peptidase (prepilin peptidase)/N-methyltransferase
VPIVALAIALLGLVLGSFAGVVAHRIVRGESPLGGRSRCDSCGAAIAARDNVPVVSWVLLRGRCRSCGVAIPARYPLVEAGVAAGFVAAYLVFEDEGAAEVALGCTFLFVLAIITLADLERRIIPNVVVAPAAVAAIALTALADPGELPGKLLAAAIAGGVLLAVSLAYPRGMGMGDVKLAFVMGLFLGRAVAPALLVGFAAGALWGLALIAKDGAGARKRAVPFGPFLALGGVVGLFAGDQLVDWYLDSFFSG